MTDYKLGDVNINIDHDSRIISFERHDNLTKEGIYAEWQAMQKLDGFDPSYDAIVDYSNVPVVDVDAADIIKINSDIPKHDPRTGNVALISGLSLGRHMLAQFFCSLTNVIAGRKHQVFNTRAEAEVWLYSLRKDK